mmetsp:Transcript_88426/g.245513  ORF Transcript_88426/g.245513 Transcript_88426/m.245513 type:complete len:332 (+) Transcript_88426:263-1258(+)
MVEASLQRVLAERGLGGGVQGAVACRLRHRLRNVRGVSEAGTSRCESRGSLCLEGRDSHAREVADLVVVEIVENAVATQQNEVTLLNLDGAQVCISRSVLPDCWWLLHCLHQLAHPVGAQPVEVLWTRQPRQLEGTIELVLLIHRSVQDAGAANVRGATGQPTDVPQARVADVRDAQLGARVVQCHHNGCRRAKRLGCSIAFRKHGAHAILRGQARRPAGPLRHDARSPHELVGKGARVQAEAPFPLAHTVGDPSSRTVLTNEEAVLAARRRLPRMRDLCRATAEAEVPCCRCGPLCLAARSIPRHRPQEFQHPAGPKSLTVRLEHRQRQD